MNNSHVTLLQPFIQSLQLLIFPLMMLNMVRNDDLDYSGATLYIIATSDIIPDIVLVPLRNYLFISFNWEDQFIPEYYEKLGYDSRNFIVCTGSAQIFLTGIVIVGLINELIIGGLLLQCLFRNS